MLSTSALATTGYTLDQIMIMANGKTADKTLIEENYNKTIAQINGFRAGALPQITSELSTSKLSIPIVPDSQYNQKVSNVQTANGTEEDEIDRIYGQDYRFGVNFASPLFSFGRLGTLYILTGLQKEITHDSKMLKTQTYFMKVIQTFNLALLAQNIYESASRAERHSRSLFKYTELEYKNGGRSKIDYLRSKSSHALAKAELARAMNEADDSKSSLKILLGIDDAMKFNLKSGSNLPSKILNSINQSTGDSRALKLKRKELEAAEKLLSYRRFSHLPSVYLLAGMSSKLQHLNIDGTTTNEDYVPTDILNNDQMQYSIPL